MQLPLRQAIHSKTNRILLGVVFVSLVVTFLRVPLLNGTFAGLAVTVLAQLYLPGYLLARALGKYSSAHPIARFAWTLGGGLGLTVILGAGARLLNVSIPLYLVALHGVMLWLALLPAPMLSPVSPWRMTRKSLPLYIMVAAACVVALGVSYESRYRFFGFEDQPIFISLADWLVAHPDVRPHDVPLRSRQIGVLNGDTRFDSDGWSYNQAAWVWASGVPARQIIWYDLGTLFIWAVPLLTFALAYTLTDKEGVAAVSAAAITIAGLLTLDNIVYHPTYTAFGRFAVFQINVLRQMSITVMLPLALLAGLAYIRTLQRHDLIIMTVTGLALAFMHPIPAMIFVMSVGITAALSWLAAPSRARLMKVLPMALVLVLILGLPFVQRFNRSGLNTADSVVPDSALDDESAAPVVSWGFLVIRDLPVVGTTYIRNPADVFYSPVITGAVILALACGWWWRRHLAAQYVFSTTALALVLFFTPGLTELFNKVASSVGLLTAMFMIPVPLAYGVGMGLLSEAIRGRRTDSPPPEQWQVWLGWLAALLVIAVMGTLIFEPFPLTASARDQLRAYNDMQSLRYLHPSQEALAASLKRHLPPGAITILVTPYDVANVAIEEVPDTLITGGRSNRNLAIEGNNRFMNEGATHAPWLDDNDLTFLAEWGVTHVITLADMTRLPQLLLQPERFERLDMPAGYVLFSVRAEGESDAIDALYGEMNRIYATMERPRWDRQGFNLILPGDVAAWQPMAGAWQNILADEPENDRARLGLAFTYSMMGADADALPLWQALNDTYPDVPVYADALASTLQAVNPAGDSALPLMAMLDSRYDAARALAVRRLLTETFVYRLDKERMQQVVDVTQNDAIVWDRLANLGQQDSLRQRAALFMDAGQWAAAAASLDALPVPERAPEDLVARAAIQLVQGDTTGALDILRPATDRDQTASNRFLHADRWENNTAAQAYYLLVGDGLEREGQMAEARAAYEAAIHHGSTIAGKYFYSLTSGLSPRESLLGEANAEWRQAHANSLPELVSLLSIADWKSLYVLQPAVDRFQDESILTVTASYGNARPRHAYPIQIWRIQVVSPDSATQYAQADVPAQFVDGALVRVATAVTLPDGIPELTEALIIVEPRYNDAVTATAAIVPVVLNRPDAAAIPDDATASDWHFSHEAGADIALKAYTVTQAENRLDLNLYWQTDIPLHENYQVFVHVVDASGERVGGRDGAPVNNRYPTGQWRSGTTILDPHTITFDPPLPPGEYSVRVGLYRYPAGERLSVTPVDERVQDNSVLLSHFENAN